MLSIFSLYNLNHWGELLNFIRLENAVNLEFSQELDLKQKVIIMFYLYNIAC